MTRVIALGVLIGMLLIAITHRPQQELEKAQYINERFKQLEEHHERNNS